MSSEHVSMRKELAAQVVELVDAFRNPLKQIEFLHMLWQADILEPVQVAPRPPPAWSAPTHGS